MLTISDTIGVKKLIVNLGSLSQDFCPCALSACKWKFLKIGPLCIWLQGYYQNSASKRLLDIEDSPVKKEPVRKRIKQMVDSSDEEGRSEKSGNGIEESLQQSYEEKMDFLQSAFPKHDKKVS